MRQRRVSSPSAAEARQQAAAVDRPAASTASSLQALPTLLSIFDSFTPKHERVNKDLRGGFLRNLTPPLASYYGPAILAWRVFVVLVPLLHWLTLLLPQHWHPCW